VAKLEPNQAYLSDLTDARWALIEPHLPARTGPGRPRTYPPRLIVNAMLYLLRTGCQWRLLPRDYPKWTAVRYHYDIWRREGRWERVNTAEAGVEVGFDGGKKVRGRKRHILVDTDGAYALLPAANMMTEASDKLCDKDTFTSRGTWKSGDMSHDSDHATTPNRD
jgi:transposase